MYSLLNYKSKFGKLSENPKKLLEGHFLRYLKKHKKKKFLEDVIYESVFILSFIKSNLILKFLYLGQ